MAIRDDGKKRLEKCMELEMFSVESLRFEREGTQWIGRDESSGAYGSMRLHCDVKQQRTHAYVWLNGKRHLAFDHTLSTTLTPKKQARALQMLIRSARGEAPETFDVASNAYQRRREFQRQVNEGEIRLNKLILQRQATEDEQWRSPTDELVQCRGSWTTALMRQPNGQLSVVWQESTPFWSANDPTSSAARAHFFLRLERALNRRNK